MHGSMQAAWACGVNGVAASVAAAPLQVPGREAQVSGRKQHMHYAPGDACVRQQGSP